MSLNLHFSSVATDDSKSGDHYIFPSFVSFLDYIQTFLQDFACFILYESAVIGDFLSYIGFGQCHGYSLGLQMSFIIHYVMMWKGNAGTRSLKCADDSC
jgi:hypothetical protein